MIKATLTEKRFFEWYEDEISVNIRASGGSYGGGSEVLIVCERAKDDLPNNNGADNG